MSRIYLSPPHMGPDERALLLEAFDSNWIAPLGPHVDAFERELAEATGVAACCALSSGTAALHLALLLHDVGPGDEVITASLTFAATANAIRYVGARPVFIDSEEQSWNLDADLLEAELVERAAAGRPAKAVLAVDLYGQCPDLPRIRALCERHGLPLIEDAAEALGAECAGRPAGAWGHVAAFSFNGNKIITTSGGGALVSEDAGLVARARYLATQAREPAPHYQHVVVGYNYRLSNLLAAVGRGQLRVLSDRVERRRAIFDRYVEALGDLPGVRFAPEAPWGRATRWLSCLEIDPALAGVGRERVRLHLESLDIEARPVWKPMHLQPVYRAFPARLTGVSERLFDRGLCLPSGSSLTSDDQDRVIDGFRQAFAP